MIGRVTMQRLDPWTITTCIVIQNGTELLCIKDNSRLGYSSYENIWAHLWVLLEHMVQRLERDRQ